MYGIMNKKILLPALFASLLFCSAAFAQPGPDNQKKMQFKKQREEMRQQIMDMLNLAPEQKNQLDKLKKQNTQDTAKIRERLKDARQALRDELDKYESNKGVLNKKVKEINKYQDQLLKYRVQHILETKKILTPDQFNKLQDIEKNRRKQFRQKLKEQIKARQSERK